MSMCPCWEGCDSVLCKEMQLSSSQEGEICNDGVIGQVDNDSSHFCELAASGSNSTSNSESDPHGRWKEG